MIFLAVLSAILIGFKLVVPVDYNWLIAFTPLVILIILKLVVGYAKLVEASKKEREIKKLSDELTNDIIGILKRKEDD